MGALGGAEQGLGIGVFQSAQGIAPGAGRIDDDARLHVCAGAGEAVLEPHPVDPAVGPEQVGDPGMGGDLGAMGQGGADGGEGEPRIVALGVVVAHPAHQPPFPDHRLGLQHATLAEQPMPPHIPEGRQQVIQPDPGPQFPQGYPVPPVHGEDERQRLDQVRCDVEQDLPFAQRLEDQAEVALFEVAQAAVNQAAGAGAGAPGDVLLIHHDRPEAAHGGISGDTGAGDSGADHEQVGGCPGQLLQ